MKWRASKTSSSSSFTSWKISFPFPEKRKKTYLVVGVFHLQVPRKKIIEKQNDTLVIGERAIKFLFSNFEQGLQYRIRKYLPNCDIYIPIYILIHIKIGLRLMDTLHK